MPLDTKLAGKKKKVRTSFFSLWQLNCYLLMTIPASTTIFEGTTILLDNQKLTLPTGQARALPVF